MRYAALDAFVSYAAGVCVLLRPGKAPPLPVDLAAAPEWEVRLAAQWVAVQQYLEAQSPDRAQHDFQTAQFIACTVSCPPGNGHARQYVWRRCLRTSRQCGSNPLPLHGPISRVERTRAVP